MSEEQKNRLFVWSPPNEENKDYSICVTATDKQEALTKLFERLTGSLGMPGLMFAKIVRDTWECNTKFDHHNQGVFFL